jgi:hypothetical protein
VRPPVPSDGVAPLSPQQSAARQRHMCPVPPMVVPYVTQSAAPKAPGVFCRTSPGGSCTPCSNLWGGCAKAQPLSLTPPSLRLVYAAQGGWSWRGGWVVDSSGAHWEVCTALHQCACNAGRQAGHDELCRHHSYNLHAAGRGVAAQVCKLLLTGAFSRGPATSTAAGASQALENLACRGVHV